MNTYKATFTAMAKVVIEFEVQAENQIDGLVLAHDYIQKANPAQAQIVSIDVDGAINTNFDRVESSAEVSPPSPLELAGKFQIEFFSDGAWSNPAIKSDAKAYAGAKLLAESVSAPDSVYGSSRILDEMGVMLMKIKAPRGGWEVEGWVKDGTEPVVRCSWEADQTAAKAVMFQLLARNDVDYVRVYDFTDRTKGPVLWKEIR